MGAASAGDPDGEAGDTGDTGEAGEAGDESTKWRPASTAWDQAVEKARLGGE